MESDDATPAQVQAGMPLIQLQTQMKLNQQEIEKAKTPSGGCRRKGRSIRRA